ncbi:hypothetical protein CDAR_109591 [Caerostris darwini]|uniref:Uncharacterized protein n=1 Tax=Caerostris darwini TaxID=1538125 RepID=A0AAV4UK67_9ARAC|nr:hypothetical protein CDAR_109591 [Caerostris darwini]
MANDNPSVEGIKVKIALQIQPTKFHRLADPIQIRPPQKLAFSVHFIRIVESAFLNGLSEVSRFVQMDGDCSFLAGENGGYKMAPPPRTDYNLLRVANHLRLQGRKLLSFQKLSEAKALCGRKVGI